MGVFIYMKKIVLIFFGLLQFSFIFAAKAKFSCDEYFLSVEYNDVIIPGDAIFVRLSVTNSKNHKKNKNDYEKKAVIQLNNEKKTITASPLFEIYKNKKQNFTQLLGGIPISQWLSDGNYSLTLTFADSEENVKEFILPSTFKTRQFNEEILELDE